jgi:hypothetical protein
MHYLAYLIVILVLVVILIGAIWYLIVASSNSVPFVRTPQGVIPDILQALEVSNTESLYDLGCGAGALLKSAKRSNPELHLVGIENNPLVLCLALIGLRRQASLRLGDLRNQDVSAATRIFVYLGPEMMADLEAKFEHELPEGALLVSLQFPLPSRHADNQIRLAGGRAHANTLYIYKY